MAAILAARHELGLGPHRLAPLVGSPRSTISDVLPRHGLSRLRDRDRASGVPIRYVREHPGELLHIDVKKLGRVPEGGGHRVRGRGNATPRSRASFDYVHGAVDDASRAAFVEIHDDERGATCARFLRDAAAWFARQGVRIERVMTDNALNCTRSADFWAALAELGARHKRTRFYRPQTNGEPSASTGRSSTSGRTSGPTAPTPSGRPCQASSTTTTTSGPTPHWTGSRRCRCS